MQKRGSKPTKKQVVKKLVSFAPTDVDPENELLGAGVGEEIDEDVEENEHEDRDLPNVGGAGRLLLRSKQLNKELTTGKYAGKAVSRDELFGSIFSTEAKSKSKSANDDDDHVPKSFVSDELEIDDDIFDDEDVQIAKRSLDRESEISQRNNGAEADDEEEALLRRHLKELHVEQEEAVQTLKQDTKREREKAQGTLNQKVIFDYLLKLRIQMQKALTVANSLPQHDMHPVFCAENSAVAEQFTNTSTLLQDLLVDLLDVQNELITQNSSVKTSTSKKIDGSSARKIIERANGKNAAGRSKMLDDLWRLINDSFENYGSYREAALENWSRRTKLAGNAKSATLQLKSINLSLMDQINNIMKDEARLIQRTQVNRSNVQILGKRKNENTTESSEKKQKTDKTGVGPLQEVDSEIFDDRDFYQVLLKDLIQDVGAASTSGSSGSDRIQDAISKSVRKKKQDRAGFINHATKGRVIRYIVHSKLVGFMAPVPKEIPETADSLFASLFGGGFQQQLQQ